MSGFSYKNFMLQIIQGSILLVSIIYFYYLISSSNFNDIELFKQMKDWEMISLLLFTITSFILGVLIDFLADSIERLFPSRFTAFYQLLKNGKTGGIVLAHHKKIMGDLCDLAAEFSNYNTKPNEFTEALKIKSQKGGINKKDRLNYVFQVAKNRAFKKCSEYQKEQLESFFTLYIFARNLAFSLIIALLLLISYGILTSFKVIHWMLVLSLAFSALLALLASYRYNSYYARIMLGSSFKPTKKKTSLIKA